MPALLAASGILLVSAGRASAQPKNDDGAELEKQIQQAIQELKKIDLNEQADLPALRRRLEEVRGQLRGIAPANPLGRRNALAVGSRFGAVVQVPPPVVVDQLELPANKGLVVLDVQPDSPAEKAGIRKNDILLEFAGKPVPSDLVDFTKDVRDHKLGDIVDAVVLRRGKRETIKGIKLAEFRAANAGRFLREAPAVIPEQRIPDAGIEKLVGVANANGESMKVRATSEGFAVELTTNNVKATLTGTRANNKGVPQHVRIQDGDTVIDTADLTTVPERYRTIVDRMLRSVGAAPIGGGRRE
jgi:hypothetical protein